MAIAAMVDIYLFNPIRLRRRLLSVWSLRRPFFVEGHSGNFYVLRLLNAQDLNFVCLNGPWALDNSLLVVDYWQPRLLSQSHRLHSFPLWVQFWGIPLHRQTPELAEALGDLIGDIAIEDNEVIMNADTDFLRVRVHIDPLKSLVQNVRLRLEDGSHSWAECKYERVFRSCAYCHMIGHTMQDFPITAVEIIRGFNAIHFKASRLFGTRITCNFDVRAAEITWQTWIRDHRMAGSTPFKIPR